MFIFNAVREKSPKPPGKKEEETVSAQILKYSAVIVDHWVFASLSLLKFLNIAPIEAD